jgi:two-component system sensor histidine kinase AtoS
MIVHEIRNPVSSVKVGLTALLKRDSLGHKERSYVELAALEVSNLERIFHDLLDYSKPLEIHSEPQSINRVLDLSLIQVNDEFDQTGISLKREFAEDLPRVNADSGRLQQVFINILMNARDAMKKGGMISVQTKEIAKKRMVCVEVADEGEGIEKNKLKRLFEPFYSTKDRGTGLGLPIVKRIIDAHGGRVEVQSKRGEGTKVIVELPHV